MTKVDELIGGLYAILQEDADGHRWTDEAADLAATITRVLDETESVQTYLDNIDDEEFNEEDEGPEPMDTPMFTEQYGG